MKNPFRLPTVVELGRSTYDALPIRDMTDESLDKYCWEDYELEMRKKYPIKYFVNYPLARFFRKRIYKIKNWYWDFSSRYIIKDHLLDLRNQHYSGGWLEPDSKFLYAGGNLLSYFIEQSHGIESFKKQIAFLGTPEGEPEQHKAYVELWNAYLFWTVERPQRLKMIEDQKDYWYEHRKDGMHLLDMLNWAEVDLAQLEKEMLMTITQHRHYMWT